jgi:hypothetical protein
MVAYDLSDVSLCIALISVKRPPSRRHPSAQSFDLDQESLWRESNIAG